MTHKRSKDKVKCEQKMYISTHIQLGSKWHIKMVQSMLETATMVYSKYKYLIKLETGLA